MLLGVFLFAFGCKKDETTTKTAPLTAAYAAESSLRWNQLFLEIDRYAPGYRPPAAARMLAYMGLGAYEAAVPGMPQYNSLQYNFQGLSLPAADLSKEYHWPSCVNAAYAAMFKYFYPHISQDNLAKVVALENELKSKYAIEAAPDVIERSIEFGKGIANAITKWSESDVAGHNAFTNPRPASYQPPAVGPNGEKLWQPTYPDYTRALFPYWGSVRPFALKDSDKIAKPPIPWSEDPNSKFYNQAKEIQLWVDNATYEDQWIAEFWSDDIFELTFEPAARLIAIGNQMAEEENISLEKSVELYAKMGMALCDVGIAVWNSKYIYNVERPVQYIRRVMDPNWKTILNNPLQHFVGMTPEFPAYPSGHSGFGGAGASILTDIFGNRGFIDRSHTNRTEFIGLPRTYSNLMELGVEDAYSRLPLGVHFRMDCDEGLRLGYLSALRVIELPWKK